MSLCARAVCIGVSLAALLTACSKPMSPVTSREAGAGDGAAASPEWSSARVLEPQTARARLRFIGDVVELREDFSTHLWRNAEFLIDAYDPVPTGSIRRDTVAANAVLRQVRWRVEGAHGPEFVVDNDPQFSAGSTFPLPPSGPVILRLRAPERAGGGVITVRYHRNFAPEVWWTGPDPSRFPPSSDGDGRAVDVLDWAHFSTSPAWPPDGRGYFGPDSFRSLPHTRRPVNDDLDRRTFFEIWGNRIYARAEGDTVHQGAWVVFATGGFDRDSPYLPLVSPDAPTLPLGWEPQPERYPVLFEHGLVGSPIGFRHRIPRRQPNGEVSQPSESTTHPNFDVFSVLYDPAVASYAKMHFPGKAYATVAAVDGHGLVWRTSQDLVSAADRVDAGLGSAEDQALRRCVLTFFVVGDEPAAPVARELARGR